MQSPGIGIDAVRRLGYRCLPLVVGWEGSSYLHKAVILQEGV